LLLQPEQFRPSVILVDEPELGLHPYAITILASLVKQASQRTQVILSTQSPFLLDNFSPEDVLVANRVDGGTQLLRLESAPLEEWLETYSLGQLWLNPSRFIPYVVMHEFEGLLFSDCTKLGSGIGRPDLVPHFQKIRDSFTTPEEINDSSETAPSKRLLKLVPGYEKPLLGTLAALEIGLDAIRSACPHFHSWLNRLEAAAL